METDKKNFIGAKSVEFFFLGLVAAFGALIIEFLAYALGENLPFADWQLALALLIASAFIEELLKGFVIYKKLASFSSRAVVMLDSAFVGLGFAATELLLIYFKSEIDFNNNMVHLTGVVLVHLTTALLAGYIVSSSHQKKNTFLWKIVLINTILHLIYNLLVLERIL